MDKIAGDKYNKILQAKYEKANLEQDVKSNSPQLKISEREEFFWLLKKYEALFNGTLGTLKNVK